MGERGHGRRRHATPARASLHVRRPARPAARDRGARDRALRRDPPARVGPLRGARSRRSRGELGRCRPGVSRARERRRAARASASLARGVARVRCGAEWSAGARRAPRARWRWPPAARAPHARCDRDHRCSSRTSNASSARAMRCGASPASRSGGSPRTSAMRIKRTSRVTSVATRACRRAYSCASWRSSVMSRTFKTVRRADRSVGA